ncbi:MAG: GNAT family N-acetyltransferase [Balneolales bacterium]
MESDPGNIQLRPLTHKDVPFAMHLKNMAQWNQLPSDWEFLIREGKGGNFLALYKGQEAGTATTLNYSNTFSWIGMVLVDPAFRGKGVGTALLNAAMDYAPGKGTVRLDATPQGKMLYDTLGFRTEREMVRMELNKPLPPPLHTGITVSSSHLPALTEFDKAVFGASRKPVLHYLHSQSPAYACMIKRRDRICGYCFGRSGSAYEQIGPLIAEKPEDARDLLLTALSSRKDKPVIMDVFTEDQSWLNLLESLGFAIQRPLIRMHKGRLVIPEKQSWQYAAAGPELG